MVQFLIQRQVYMSLEQFQKFGGLSQDIEALKLRSRLFAVGACKASDLALAAKLFKHSRTFARKAHTLENMAKGMKA